MISEIIIIGLSLTHARCGFFGYGEYTPSVQVCLAYRGAVPSSLFVNLGYVSSASVWTTAQIDVFVNATVIRDLVWHFNCFDIRPAISANPTISSGQFHTIIQVSFASSQQPFWIDEFAIARNPVTCKAYIIRIRDASVYRMQIIKMYLTCTQYKVCFSTHQTQLGFHQFDQQGYLWIQLLW